MSKLIASHDIVKVHEIKRNIALAKVKLSDGRSVFVNPNLIPIGLRQGYYIQRQFESQDGQS